jgi:hypothetical protein
MRVPNVHDDTTRAVLIELDTNLAVTPPTVAATQAAITDRGQSRGNQSEPAGPAVARSCDRRFSLSRFVN